MLKDKTMAQKVLRVQDLLDILQTIPDKSLPVFIYNAYNGEIDPIEDIDVSLTDRVDIQVTIGDDDGSF